MKRLSRIFLGLVVLLVVTGAGTAWFVRDWLATPLNIPSTGHELMVPAGGSLAGIANELAEEGILSHPTLLVALGRLSGQAGRIQAGEYELERGLKPGGLLSALVDGKVRLHRFTIVEGWTVPQIMAALADTEALTRTLQTTDPRELARLLELDTKSAEGLFLPETYSFARGTTDRQLLQWAHDALTAERDAAWANRDPNLPLTTPYELVILASIVERETALASERPRIAGVFVRRLEKGMLLQTDPAVIYGVAGFDGNLTRRHLETDTPFNTYTRTGLPPTPIAAPGADALRAAARPAPGDELYFVASGAGDGSHRFSATLDEHNRAVSRYLAALRQLNRRAHP